MPVPMPGMGGGPPGMGGPPPGAMPGGPPPGGAPPGGPPSVPPPPPGGMASAGQNPQNTQMLLSMMAGIGLQSVMQTLSKFMKTATTIGGRQEKPVRLAQDGAQGPADAMAQRGLPPGSAGQMPLVGAAMGAGPLAPPGGPPAVPPPGM